MSDANLDQLDEFLVRIRVANNRPAYRRRLLTGATYLTSLAELRVLRAVERRTCDRTGPSIGDIAEELGIEHSTASRSVAAAVEAGLLTRSASADDQRRSNLELTERGRKGLAETTERRRALLAESVSEWSEDELAHLTEMLARLADDVDAGGRS